MDGVMSDQEGGCDVSEKCARGMCAVHGPEPTGKTEEARHPTREAIYLSTGCGARVLVPGCWTYFNIVLIMACFGFFTFNAVVIIREFVDGLTNPPFAGEVQVNQPIDLPTIAMCNGLPGVSFGDDTKLSMLQFSDRTTSDGFVYCERFIDGREPNGSVADCTKLFGPSGATFEKFTLPYPSEQALKWHCLAIFQFPGFGKYTALNKLFPTRLTVDISTQIGNSSTSTKQVGVDGVRFFVFPDVETYSLAKKEEDWFYFVLLSDNTGLFPSGYVSTVGVSKNRLEYFEADGWTTQLDIYKLQISSAERIDDRVAKDVAQVEFMYSDNRVLISKQKRVRFSVALGALGGWMGLLSDGWGLLSIYFMFQKFVHITMKRTKSLYWWTKAYDRRQTDLR
mmetsp:Transcript_16640/g.26978  ORF Transcript_16640/g.26978 Transcript_16640/m.26978 type:complete len:395 (+) Transcript_16640:462-1646(+)